MYLTMQLAVRDISVSFGARRALKDVTFTVPSQGRALLLGPSGSGKSTLLNTICGLQRPDQGEVQLGEHHLVGPDGLAGADQIRRGYMGIIFQTLRLISALDVRKNLLLAQRLQNGASDPDLVDATLARLGLGDKAQARPFELSQGEAQRAAIARALVVSPAILIADEPTSALDHANTQIVAQLLIEAAETAGASLLIATHDERLMPFFERRIDLVDGRVSA
ncbi:MAG: ATP-binding cassette domain-containing protein [Erythrobacter sp.]|nr:ATP-binding cassette domain-containing protein [Erythrobacter sp.]